MPNAAQNFIYFNAISFLLIVLRRKNAKRANKRHISWSGGCGHWTDPFYEASKGKRKQKNTKRVTNRRCLHPIRNPFAKRIQINVRVYVCVCPLDLGNKNGKEIKFVTHVSHILQLPKSNTKKLN